MEREERSRAVDLKSVDLMQRNKLVPASLRTRHFVQFLRRLKDALEDTR